MESLEKTSLLPQSDISYGSQASIPHQQKFKVYKRRWYILFTFFMCAMLNGLIWNTWGPIQGTAQVVFGWNDTTVTLIVFWGPIIYMMAFIPVSWLMDVKGLRVCTLLLGTCSFVAAGLRAIPLSNLLLQTCLINLGAIISNIAGPVAMALGPLLSAVWFPPHQRTTSTAISSLGSYLGTGVAFVIGPMLVPEVGNHSRIGESIDFKKIREGMNATQLSYLKGKIMNLMYVEFAASAVLLLLVVVYFPKKPKLPPSITATVGRVDFKSGFKSLLRNKQFLLLVLINGVTNGVYNGWMSILDLDLSQFGIGQYSAGWLGFGSSMSGIIAGVALAILADIVSRHMKVIQLVLLFCATASFLGFTLMCAGIISYYQPVLYLTCISAGFFTSGTIPLFFEMAVETAYPVAEGITAGLLTVAANVLQAIFYIFPMLPNFGLKWINWCTSVVFAICIPLLAVWKEKYYRLEVDDRGPSVQTSDSLVQS